MMAEVQEERRQGGEDLPPTSPPSSQHDPEEGSLTQTIQEIWQRLTLLGAGSLAELRRLRPDGRDCWRSPTFWRLYVELIAPHRIHDEEHQRRWAMIVSGMVHLGHKKGWKVGQALAEAGYSERRLARLLSADEMHLPADLRAGIVYLASKQGIGVDWTDLATLILTRPGSKEYEACRRRIAEDYFRNTSA